MTAVIDALAYLGPNLFGPTQTERQLLDRMDRAGIHTAAVTPARPHDYHLRPATAAVLAECQRHSERLLALARVDPNRNDAAHDAGDAVANGARGVFLHPREEVFAINDPRVDAVATVCAERNVPLFIAAGFPWVSEPLQVAELAARHPAVPMVMTNGGQLNISGLGQHDARMAMENRANLHIATNGVYRQDFLDAVATQFGASRVLFASCSPQFDPSYEVLRGWMSDLEAPQRQEILRGTAARLLGL